MFSVFLIDDHPAVRQGYRVLIRRESDIFVCGESASGIGAIEQIVECEPDIVVLDVSLQGTIDGVALLRQISEARPDLPVLVVSGHDETLYAEKMLRMGARGYVMKGDALIFMQALRQVLNGEIYHSKETRNRKQSP
jgi:DNA-binding NarL/FixJ family response regulator